MKKVTIFAAVAAATLMTSCTPSAPKADLKNEIDTLSYTLGMANTQGLKPYLTMQMGVDTTSQALSEFIKGVVEGAHAGDNKDKMAYFAGIQIGQQISNGMIKGINREVFGENDTVSTISINNFLAGFIAGTTDKDTLMSMQSAVQLVDEKMDEIRKKRMEEQFGANKAESEAYMANIANEPGVQSLGDGIYYKVLTEGTGATPAADSRVKVHYEGTLPNGTKFDSSYDRGEATTFPVNQVIPGWTKALQQMKVGSKWVIYIPQDQAYGERQMGQIAPYSALTFTVDLVGIED